MPEGTIFIVDDNDAFRCSTQWLLESHGLRVTGFQDGRSFLEAFGLDDCARNPGCVLLDIRMPGLTGLQVQEALRGRGVRVPLIFITAHGDVSLAVQAMRRGAFNFLEKPFPEEALIADVMSALAHDGERITRDHEAASVLSCIGNLTPREKQVLDLVAQGALNKTIADVLGISIKTVELHRSRVMEKMGADSLAQLIRMTVRVNG